MPVYVSLPGDAGIHELAVYTGGAGNGSIGGAGQAGRDVLGIERIRYIDRNPPVDEARFGGQTVMPGQRFKRLVTDWDADANAGAGDFINKGPWELCAVAEIREGAISQPQRRITTSAGQPLRNPLGLAVMDSAGGPVTTPAQPHDPFTGEPT